MIDWALGLPGTFLELSGLDNCPHWRFRVRGFVAVLLIGSQQLADTKSSGCPPLSLFSYP